MGTRVLKEDQMSPEQIGVEAGKWVSSADGQRKLADLFERVNETVNQLSADRFVDGHTLRMPLSI